MRYSFVLAISILTILVFSNEAFGQPISRSYPFVMQGRDTVTENVAWQFTAEPAGSKGRIIASPDGHFLTSSNGERIRFFGTELSYTSQFLSGEDPITIARRFRKLGINAIRLTFNDYSWDNDGSLILATFDAEGTYYKQGSFVPNLAQFARLDTLIYELKKEGIYTFFVLHNNHTFYPSDSLQNQDSLFGYGYFAQYWDQKAATLIRGWAKTVLSHVNPLTGNRYADEPAIAGVELMDNIALNYGWHYNLLNYIDSNNFYGRGGSNTISYHHSRKLDSLFSQYLLKKYGSDAGIDEAWKNGTVTNPPNVLPNGSFENVGSSAWSFNAEASTTATQSRFSPAQDSQFCTWVYIEDIGTAPSPNRIYLLNNTARLGKDTLYEMSFWAKVRYDDVHKVVSRPIQVLMADYTVGQTWLNRSFTIDTTWKQYSVAFRPKATGTEYLFFLFGESYGDVLLDGVSIKQRQEFGLVPGESAVASRVGRLRYADYPLVHSKRYKDMGLFYDSLQRQYYTHTRRAINDTLKSTVLMSYYTPGWWANILDAAITADGDFTSVSAGHDYIRPLDGGSQTDSTWQIFNVSLAANDGNMLGLPASQSVEGKPHVVMFSNPTVNQFNSANAPYLAAYAGLQDWDGIFFRLWSQYRNNAFSNYMYPAVGGFNTYYDISGNPGILSTFPSASHSFRNGYVKTSPNEVTVIHDSADVFLASYNPDNRGSFGTEGYIHPTIASIFKVRQKFNALVHKEAAAYPFVYDTAAKYSQSGELAWHTSSGMMTVDAPKHTGAIGRFTSELITAGNTLAFRRLDDARDNLSLMLTSLDDKPLQQSGKILLTASTRAQNSGMVWLDEISVSNKWGMSPTIMSAAKLEIYFVSDSSQLRVSPLNPLGRTTSNFSYAKRDTTKPNTFIISLDQYLDHTPWYLLETFGTTPSSVRIGDAVPNVMQLAIHPNPLRGYGKTILDLPEAGLVTIHLYNVLGEMLEIITSEYLDSGRYEFPIDARMLPAGAYILRASCGSKRIETKVSVTK